MGKLSDFWSRQREKLQQEGVIKPVVRSEGPWWAANTSLIPQPKQPENPVQPRTAPSADSCPHCSSTNYTSANSSSAKRCFECGYVQGRQLNEPNMPSGMMSNNVQTLKVKQLPSQGHFGRSVAEINANNAILEQSAQGRAQIG